MVDGKNQTAVLGKPAVFRSEAELKDLIKVMVDGKIVSTDNYIVKAGSTIVTLSAEFVKSLGNGKHTMSIVSTTGAATADFTVVNQNTLSNKTDNPKTS